MCDAECVLSWIKRDRVTTIQNWKAILNKDGAGFRSLFEERVFSFLRRSKLGPVLYEALTFLVGDGVYTPDFFIPSYMCFLETKGLWQVGQKKKFRAFRAQYPDIPILIIPWTIQGDF